MSASSVIASCMQARTTLTRHIANRGSDQRQQQDAEGDPVANHRCNCSGSMTIAHGPGATPADFIWTPLTWTTAKLARCTSRQSALEEARVRLRSLHASGGAPCNDHVPCCVLCLASTFIVYLLSGPGRPHACAHTALSFQGVYHDMLVQRQRRHGCKDR